MTEAPMPAEPHTSQDVETAAQLLGVDSKELAGSEPLVAVAFRGANSVEAVNTLVKASSFQGLACPSNTDEVPAYTNFFLKQHNITTATFEECTCCVIKPHATKERLVGALLCDITSRGFVISAVQVFRLERAAAAEFLEVYDGVVPEYDEMVDELSSGSVVALEIRLKPQVLANRGNTDRQAEVVEKFRAACGPWDVNMAKKLQPDTLRVRNAIHCTDMPKDGADKSAYFFKILNSHNIDGWK